MMAKGLAMRRFVLASARRTATVVLTCLSSIVFVAAAFAQSPHDSESGKASALVVGSCNVVQQNVTASGGATIVNQIDCLPDRPDESFVLRYLWLDAVTSSYLVAGRFDPALAKLLPERPVVVRNPVYDQLREIIEKFGRPDHLAGEEPQYSVNGERDNLQTTAKWSASRETRNKLRVYSAEEDIIWPDLSALAAVFETTDWPAGFRMSYNSVEDDTWRERQSTIDFQNKMISCVQLYSPISSEMLASYWDLMKQLEDGVRRDRFKRDGVIHPNANGSAGDLGASKTSALRNKTIDAMSYFGRAAWPEDFLMAFGNGAVGGCGVGAEYDYMFGFYAKPRKLHTLVAVVEPRRKDLQIERLIYLSDSETRLRPLGESRERIESPSGVISVRAGEMAVIPLRIELRYDSEGFRDIVDSEEPRQIYQKIRALKIPIVKFTGRESERRGRRPPPLHTVFSKSLSAFREPEGFKVNQTYVFGPSLGLSTVTIKGVEVPVRSVPPAAVAYLGPAEIGSCPFLFVSDGSEEPRRIGRVLIGASDETRARTEQILLPPGATSVFVSEQEPEITYLQSVSISDAATGEETLLATDVVLHPGDAREFVLPPTLRDQARLTVRGYYLPLRFPPVTNANAPRD
jgi:hypothetical protein